MKKALTMHKCKCNNCSHKYYLEHFESEEFEILICPVCGTTNKVIKVVHLKDYQKKAKKVMRFDFNGKLIRTYPSAYNVSKFGDEQGSFNISSVTNCCRNIARSYRGHLWIYEEDYSEEYVKKRIDAVDGKPEIRNRLDAWY